MHSPAVQLGPAEHGAGQRAPVVEDEVALAPRITHRPPPGAELNRGRMHMRLLAGQLKKKLRPGA